MMLEQIEARKRELRELIKKCFDDHAQQAAKEIAALVMELHALNDKYPTTRKH